LSIHDNIHYICVWRYQVKSNQLKVEGQR
jgi:hypothetical protein